MKRLLLILTVASIALPATALAFDSHCYDENGVPCTEGPPNVRGQWRGELDEHRVLFEWSWQLAGLPADLPDRAEWRVYTDGSTLDYRSIVMCPMEEEGFWESVFSVGESIYGMVIEGEGDPLDVLEDLADEVAGYLLTLKFTEECPVGGVCVEDSDTPSDIGLCDFSALETYSPAMFTDATRALDRHRDIAEFAQLPDFSWGLWDHIQGNETCDGIQGLTDIDVRLNECHQFTRHMGAYNSNHFLPQAQYMYLHYHDLALERAAACQRLRDQVPAERAGDFERYVEACEAEAMTLESVGAHFLHDAWSVGHMWERWGSPDPRDFDTYAEAHVIAMLSGLIHGSEAVTDMEDAMCSPSPGVGFSPASGDPVAAVGDLYLDRLIDEDHPRFDVFGGQRELMRSCVVASLLDVYEALGEPYGSASPASGLMSVDPTSDDCFGQRATNESLYIGAGLGTSATAFAPIEAVLTGELLPYISDFKRGENLTDEDRAFLESDTQSNQYQRDLMKFAFVSKVLAEANPYGTEMATGALNPIVNTQPNSAYLPEGDELPAPYADPRLPWRPNDDPAQRGDDEDERRRLLASAMHRAHLTDWCDTFAEGDPQYDMELLRDRVETLANEVENASTSAEEEAARDQWEVACEVCTEFARRHVRDGTPGSYDTDDEPLCYYAATNPDEVQYVYVEPECNSIWEPTVDESVYCGCPSDECPIPGRDESQSCVFASCRGGGCDLGDPHLTTFDEVTYDFQGAGEFRVVESAQDDFEIQARQEPANGVCSTVTVNTAVAVSIGGSRVTITIDEDAEQRAVLRIDGTETRLTRPVRFGDCSTLSFYDGRYIFTVAPRIETGLPDVLIVDARSTYLNLDVDPGGTRTFSGLLGSNDGDPSNDIALRDGTTLSPPINWSRLYGEYADSWRITDADSLFDYEAGETTDTFSDPTFPGSRMTSSAIPEADRQMAEMVCTDAGVTDPDVLEDCTIDVACTGDPSYADVHASRDPGTPLQFGGRVPVETQVVESAAPPSLERGELASAGTVYLIEEARDAAIDSEITIDLPFHQGGYYDLGTLEEAACAVTIPSATVDSHLLYWDFPDDVIGHRAVTTAEYTFDSEIVGVIVNEDALETSDALFGVAGTTYPTGGANGLDTSAGAVEIEADGRTIRVRMAGLGNIERVRILTAPTALSDGSQAGAQPKSCLEHLQNGASDDGVYSIDPDGAGGLAPFDVFCDMTTDGGGWTMVTKVSEGAGASGECAWGLGQLYRNTTATRDRQGSAEHFSTPIAGPLWNDRNFTVTEARVEVLEGGTVAKSLLFDATGSTYLDWFSETRLLSGSWSDLLTADKNAVWINDNLPRHFYVNHSWGGCANDDGWLQVIGGPGCDAYADNPPNGYPDIQYSTSDTFETWSSGAIGHADALAVFVR